jgi:hypothetical protein
LERGTFGSLFFYPACLRRNCAICFDRGARLRVPLVARAFDAAAPFPNWFPGEWGISGNLFRLYRHVGRLTRIPRVEELFAE